MKNNKAITLIALVITIVVLIILAAVAINLSLGNNGIFNRAKTAKEQYQNAQEYEETEIAKVTNEIDNYTISSRNNNYSMEVISTRSPSALNAWTKIADYPSGFSYDNCYISGGYVILDNRKYVLPSGDANAWLVNLGLTTNGVEMYLRYDNEFVNKDVMIVLTRYK